jgi:hypothetical protein
VTGVVVEAKAVNSISATSASLISCPVSGSTTAPGVHRRPRVLRNRRDRPGHGGVVDQHDGERHLGLQAGGDHGCVAVGGVAADQDLAGRADGAGGPDRLGDHRRGALAGAGLTGAQPDPGDHRRTAVGADCRHEWGQSAAKHLLTGDLRVPEAGALLAVPEHRP